MQVTALELDSWDGLRWIAVAVVVSLVVHVSLAAGVSRIPEREIHEPVWMEMVVVEAPEPPAPVPVPEPEPEPEPEPKPPPPKPEVVEYQPPVEPQPVQPQPKPVPRVVQGLNSNSFLPGTGAGDVRAGNTTATKATDDTMSLDEAKDTVILPFASVTNPPKIRFKPTLEVPESVSAAQIQGRVELLLTVDAEGKVVDLKVVESLHPDADEACKAAIAKSRWKPGDKDGTPVVTANVPYSCKFEMSPD